MSRAVTTASTDLDRVVDFTTEALGVSETQALDVVDQAVSAVEHLLTEHRSLVADELLSEADRYTRGAFADGIRHAAAVVLDPPVVLIPDDETPPHVTSVVVPGPTVAGASA